MNNETTVREWVVQYPQTQRVFEKYGVDYCCGAGRALQAAAERAGADLGPLLSELEASMAELQPEVEGQTNWSKASLSELIDHIVAKHHAFMKSEMPRLEPILRKIAEVHGPSHGTVLGPLLQKFLLLKADIDSHLRKEEEVLFPYIKQVETGLERSSSIDLEQALAETVEEHEAVGAVLAGMRSLTCDYELPGDACPTYGAAYYGLMQIEGDLHQHIHLENNILFPRSAVLETAG